MAQKATWLFNGFNSDSGLAWGYSESWYSNLQGAQLESAMDVISDLRVQLCPSDAEIVGYRIGQPNGRSYVVRKSYKSPNDAQSTSNVQVDSALCQMSVNGTATVKKFWIHDLPDNAINATTISRNISRKITAFCQGIALQNFLCRYVVPTAPNAPILQITALGVVTTNAPIAAGVGDLVQFLACRDANGKTIRGKYAITAVADNRNFTIAHWPGNVVARSGTARIQQFGFATCAVVRPGPHGESGSVVKAGSRKVGRPFFQSRGRVSNKR